MNKGFEVFNIDPSLQSFGLQSAIKVLTTKIPESSKKQRKVGGTTLTYIGGHTVIRLLNEAFNYQWSFEIVTEDIVQSIPKFNKYAKAGQPTHEEQPPVAKVLGRLTVPGLGVKEQYGSKVLIGGATEQESAFKSASTDAMKKCASLFGIGLELYGEDEFNFDLDEAITPSQPATPAQTYKKPTVEQQVEQIFTPAPPAQQAPPAQAPTQQPVSSVQQPVQTASQPTGQVEWDVQDIQRLKDLKAIMGITDNTQLDPFVREFLDTEGVTWQNVKPTNIKAFNIYLGKKAEAMQ